MAELPPVTERYHLTVAITGKTDTQISGFREIDGVLYLVRERLEPDGSLTELSRIPASEVRL